MKWIWLIVLIASLGAAGCATNQPARIVVRDDGIMVLAVPVTPQTITSPLAWVRETFRATGEVVENHPWWTMITTGAAAWIASGRAQKDMENLVSWAQGDKDDDPPRQQTSEKRMEIEARNVEYLRVVVVETETK